jgi:hypothetical protein
MHILTRTSSRNGENRENKARAKYTWQKVAKDPENYLLLIDDRTNLV